MLLAWVVGGNNLHTSACQQSICQWTGSTSARGYHISIPAVALQKLVGPGTPRPPHPIQPQSVADFVEEAAPHGLVLAAFGSTIQSMVLTHTDLQELAKGFASLAPTRVLWAMSDKGLPDGVQLGDLPLGSNTKVVSWVDYNVSAVGRWCGMLWEGS